MDAANMGKVSMQIALDRASRVPLYRQIESQIRALIVRGHLPPEARLPAERALADHLGVNRTTVVNAYRELAADGLVEGRVGRGTLVTGPAPQPPEELVPPVPLAWSGLIRPRARWPQSPLVERVAELVSRPGVISLATGVAVPVPSPHIRLQEAVQHAVADGEQSLLGDSPAAGMVPLRAELGRRLAMKGCNKPSENQVFVLSGSQQGLYLVAQLLLEPGDAVLVESPTYLGALEAFRAVGARLIEAPMDSEGVRTDAVERILHHANVRLIYTIPTFQNPTGVTMSGERRRRLLALAQQHQIPILEDDLYGELFYGASPPAPLRAADRAGCVLYLGGISPVLGPGLRLGWLVAPSGVIEPLTALRQAMDLHPNNLMQKVVLELLLDGSYDAHLDWVRAEYAHRRDIMVAALRDHMPPDVHWSTPEGGFYVWCSLPTTIDTGELLTRAASEGVVFVPGEPFYANRHGEPYMRLSFVHAPMETIPEGVRRLAKAIGQLRGHGPLRSLTQGSDRPVV